MKYHIDDDALSLDDVRLRLLDTDLIPSRNGIDETFNKLKQSGIDRLSALRTSIKLKKNVEILSAATGIEVKYLTLLRREIEGYFPEAKKITGYDWLSKTEIEAFLKAGLAVIRLEAEASRYAR